MAYSYINSNKTSKIKRILVNHHSTMNGKTPYKTFRKIGLNSLFSKGYNTLNSDFYIFQYIIFLFITLTSINQFLRLIVMFHLLRISNI